MRTYNGRTPNLVFDWDGVLHEHGRFRESFGKVDLAPIRMAHERGYAVSVLTSNNIVRVAEKLAEAGYICVVTSEGAWDWEGGDDGRVILVTNRKGSGLAFVDDRGIGWRYGDDPELIFKQAEAVNETLTREGRHRRHDDD